MTLKYFGNHSIKDDNWKKYFIELYQLQFAKEFVTFDPNSSPMHNKDLKVTVVGDSQVGKTLYIMTYSKMIDKWNYKWGDYVPTVMDNNELKITLKEKTVILSLWDTAGHNDYDR